MHQHGWTNLKNNGDHASGCTKAHQTAHLNGWILLYVNYNSIKLSPQGWANKVGKINAKSIFPFTKRSKPGKHKINSS